MLVSFCVKQIFINKIINLPKYISISFHKFKQLKYKRIPACTYFKGSYTLEAAIVYPFFAGAMVSILFFFRVMQVETAVKEALYYSGRMTAIACSATDSKAVTLATTEALMLTQLKKYDVIKDYVYGGYAGVSILNSDLSGENIDICAKYKVKLPINFWGKATILLEQHSCNYKWTGKNVSESSEDTYVYYTEYGEVYHMSKKCSYIDLSIKSVKRAYMDDLRNKSGRKYSACSCIAEEKYSTDVYITDYGVEYHSSLKCGDLKRTVHVAKLSEMSGKRKCTKCGGG